MATFEPHLWRVFWVYESDEESSEKQVLNSIIMNTTGNIEEEVYVFCEYWAVQDMNTIRTKENWKLFFLNMSRQFSH